MSLNRLEDNNSKSKPQLGDSRPDSSKNPARGISATRKSGDTTPFMMQRRKEQQQAQLASTAAFGSEDKARINELTRQVDENNQQILLQRLEIRQLKDQISRLLEGAQGMMPSMMSQQQ